MVDSTHQPKGPDPVVFTVIRNHRKVRLSYEQLFATGYELWFSEKYDKATEIFQSLTRVSGQGPRAHILLAHCRAMTGDFDGCSSALAESLPDLQYWNAHDELHDIFVLWRFKMYLEVRQSLEKFIADHPELPTPCLLLADLLYRLGNRKQPPRLLQQAIRRDRADGAVAKIARRHLSALLAELKSPRAPARSSADTLAT